MDEAIDDLTNCECEVAALADHAEAIAALQAAQQRAETMERENAALFAARVDAMLAKSHWEQRAEAAEALAEALKAQVRQADERGDDAMRRAHEAEAERDALKVDAAALREIAALAYRALDDAARVLFTVDPEDADEGERLEGLMKRCADVSVSLFTLLRLPTTEAPVMAGALSQEPTP